MGKVYNCYRTILQEAIAEEIEENLDVTLSDGNVIKMEKGDFIVTFPGANQRMPITRKKFIENFTIKRMATIIEPENSNPEEKIIPIDYSIIEETFFK